MKATYDPLADAVSITFKKGKVSKTKEVSPGVFLDVDKNDTPLYLEVLDASKPFKPSGNSFQKFSMGQLGYSKHDLRTLVATR